MWGKLSGFSTIRGRASGELLHWQGADGESLFVIKGAISQVTGTENKPFGFLCPFVFNKDGENEF
jgi:hypothetical protein